MRVLVTGSEGLVGRAVCTDLRAAGHGLVPYDLTESQDILDLGRLREAAQGCDAIIHSAALLGRDGDSTDEIMAVNLKGTLSVLTVAAECGARRVVFLSSVDVLGVFKGESPPDYLPLDNDHPCRPTTPYGVSKLVGESLCELSVKAGGPPVISLRPPGVWSPETYGRIQRARAHRPAFEWDPFWEFGAFIDVRDLSRACRSALTCDLDGYESVLVSAADITTSGRTSRDLAEFVHPEVEWRGGPEYDADRYRSLIDIDPARHLLDWEPEHTWKKGSDPFFRVQVQPRISS